MTTRRYELTDFEWSVIEPLLPNKPRGVPRADDRRVLNGIFWRLRTGSPRRRRQTVVPLLPTCNNRPAPTFFHSRDRGETWRVAWRLRGSPHRNCGGKVGAIATNLAYDLI
jgi:transposase